MLLSDCKQPVCQPLLELFFPIKGKSLSRTLQKHQFWKFRLSGKDPAQSCLVQAKIPGIITRSVLIQGLNYQVCFE